MDDRWIAPHGIGRFAREVLTRLPDVDRLETKMRPLHPMEPLWLMGILLRRRPHVYFSPGFNPPLRSPVPFVFTIHDLIHLRFPEEGSRARRAYYRWVVRPAARRASRVLTVSSFSKDEIIKWAGVPEDHVVVVGHGVGPVFSPEGPTHDPGYPYVLFVGLRRPHKNVDRLLAAFARAELPPSTRLLFVGPAHPWREDVGPGDEWTAQLAREHGVADRVVFAGRVTDEELAARYRGASAVVLASLYEGFGLPALEAMASGVPVVAARAGAIPEVVDEAAELVDPLDSTSIASGLSRVIADSSHRDDLRRKGLERASVFSWDSVSTKVWRVLEDARAST